MHWKEGGIVNPYRFSNGMIAAANRYGASIFGNSRVTGCERDASGWRVRTANGSVRAAKVILCTSGNVGNSFFPQLVNTHFPLVASAMATKPLPASLIDTINPSRAAFIQAPTGLYPFVIDENNRIITATIPGPLSAHDGQRYFELLLRYLHRTWPGTREVKIEMSTYWTGMCACSSSVIHADYPKLYQVDDGVIGFMNLGTWGNVLGPLLGMNLANAIADERMDELVIPFEAPVSVKFRKALDLKIRYALIPLARIVDRLGLA